MDQESARAAGVVGGVGRGGLSTLGSDLGLPRTGAGVSVLEKMA